MGTIYSKPRANFNRFNEYHEPERFTIANESGMQWYTGANVRVYFDDIRVNEMDSFGFQLAQNVRPVYGYHSHVFNTIQYGTKLAQGYFQTALTESAYIPTILATIEEKYRKGFAVDVPTINTISNDTQLQLGQTLDEAVAEFSRLSTSEQRDTWRHIADKYDAIRWGFQEQAKPSTINVPGLLPAKPKGNFFAYNPPGSHIAAHGFTVTILYGDPDQSLEDVLNNKSGTVHGTVRQLHEVHIIAGPNQQIDLDGKPIAELYTYIAKDVS